jgi:hypothetical protein
VGRLGSLRDLERGLVYMVRTAWDNSIWGGGDGVRLPSEESGDEARELSIDDSSLSLFLASEYIVARWSGRHGVG